MDDFVRVVLRFPKARILVNNFIMELEGNCSLALLEASLEYGIIPWGTKLPESLNTHDTCQALTTAEFILRKHLKSKNIEDDEKHVRAFINNFQIFHTLEQSRTKHKIECLRFTPVMFDLLLQQLECI